VRGTIARVKSLATPGAIDEVLTRLSRVDESSTRRWGTLTPHEMLCHLTDSYLGMLGERPLVMKDTAVSRTLIRWIALHTPLQWPKGVMTMAEVDPRRQGTRPAAFERDRERLLAVIPKFAAADARYVPHPIFGPLTTSELMVWGYRHPDHHLRQFGL
jgi:hypothetical protein